MILSQILSRILSSRVYGEHVEPTILKNPFPLFSAGFLVGIFFFSSCASTKHVETIPLETICDHQVHDTLYINNVQYDSIFVSQNHYVDRGKDTILIRQHDIEYRYKLLRDTIYKTHIDTIPVLREVEVVREVPRPKTWFDHLSRYAFFLLCGALLFLVYRCIRKFI